MTDVNDISKGLLKLASMKRQNLDRIEEALGDAEVIRETTQAFVDKDPWQALDDLVEAYERIDDIIDLGLFLPPQTLSQIREALDFLVETLPGMDDMQAVVNTYDEASEAAQICRDHKDNPREYETEEKQTSRDDLSSAVEEFGNTLDAVAAPKEEK